MLVFFFFHVYTVCEFGGYALVPENYGYIFGTRRNNIMYLLFYITTIMAYTCGAGWQFVGKQVGDSLKVVVASVAKVRSSEAEEHSYRTAITALVLEQVGAMFGAHLSSGHVAAPTAHQFGRIVFSSTHVQLAPSFAAVVGLRSTRFIKITFV